MKSVTIPLSTKFCVTLLFRTIPPLWPVLSIFRSKLPMELPTTVSSSRFIDWYRQYDRDAISEHDS